MQATEPIQKNNSNEELNNNNDGSSGMLHLQQQQQQQQQASQSSPSLGGLKSDGTTAADKKSNTNKMRASNSSASLHLNSKKSNPRTSPSPLPSLTSTNYAQLASAAAAAAAAGGSVGPFNGPSSFLNPLNNALAPSLSAEPALTSMDWASSAPNDVKSNAGAARPSHKNAQIAAGGGIQHSFNPSPASSSSPVGGPPVGMPVPLPLVESSSSSITAGGPFPHQPFSKLSSRYKSMPNIQQASSSNSNNCERPSPPTSKLRRLGSSQNEISRHACGTGRARSNLRGIHVTDSTTTMMMGPATADGDAVTWVRVEQFFCTRLCHYHKFCE